MNFWDSSSILPLLVREDNSRTVRALLAEMPEMAIWWGTSVECVSALARKEREGHLSLEQFAVAQQNLATVEDNAVCIDPSLRVRRVAHKLLRRYPLRAADSLQLAAACVLAGEFTMEYGFVCNDERLITAASKEGFSVVTP